MLLRRNFIKVASLVGAALVLPNVEANSAVNLDAKAPLFAIGDVHGTLEPLKNLVEALPKNARLLFLGDLANKGGETLEVLRYVKGLGGRATVVLGNHDIRCLSVASGAISASAEDKLQKLQEAPDREELLNWLRKQKLAYYEDGILFVHAGVHSNWTVEETLAYAKELEKALQGNDWKEVLKNIQAKNTKWDPNATGFDRLRSISNILTNLRFVTISDGEPDWVSHAAPSAAPEGQIAWFDFPGRKTAKSPIVFGHWIRCGLMIKPNIQCLDSGSWKGGMLTANRYPKNYIVQKENLNYRPKAK